MTTTNSNRCSRLAALAVLLLVVVAGAAPAAAVSVADREAPDSAAVGSQVTATVTLSELYQEPDYAEWKLAGATDLTDVTWTVMWYDQTGARVNQTSYDGGEFDGATVAADANHAEVRVRVTGTVPRVENHSYDPEPSFALLSLTQARSGGTSNGIVTREAVHYTNASRSARQALDSAAATIEEAGNPEEAQGTFDSAVDAYDGGEFDLATRLADRAADEAAAAESSRQRNRLVTYGAVGVVALAAVIGGGVLFWRSRGDDYDKLG